MNFAAWFGALAKAFAHPHVDPAAAAEKIGKVRAGLEMAASVVGALPDSKAKSEALGALHAAASAAGEAIVVAHTLEKVIDANAPVPAAG
jgi:hypothetical protein